MTQDIQQDAESRMQKAIESLQGEFAKMLFVHVPSVIAAYVALGIGLVGGVWYLWRGTARADRISCAGAPSTPEWFGWWGSPSSCFRLLDC